jgi:hypothetical protein
MITHAKLQDSSVGTLTSAIVLGLDDKLSLSWNAPRDRNRALRNDSENKKSAE